MMTYTKLKRIQFITKISVFGVTIVVYFIKYSVVPVTKLTKGNEIQLIRTIFVNNITNSDKRQSYHPPSWKISLYMHNLMSPAG